MLAIKVEDWEKISENNFVLSSETTEFYWDLVTRDVLNQLQSLRGVLSA